MLCYATNEQEYLLRQHGIDFAVLSQKHVIERDSCFWTVLQSHTDRFYWYYNDQEESIVQKASLLRKVASSDERSAEEKEDLGTSYNKYFGGFPQTTTAIPKLYTLKKEINDLKKFLELNKNAHTKILEMYSEINSEDVLQTEVKELEKTHSFWNGSRLEVLMEFIDESIQQIHKKIRDEVTRKSSRRRFSITGNANCNEDKKPYGFIKTPVPIPKVLLCILSTFRCKPKTKEARLQNTTEPLHHTTEPLHHN